MANPRIHTLEAQCSGPDDDAGFGSQVLDGNDVAVVVVVVVVGDRSLEQKP